MICKIVTLVALVLWGACMTNPAIPDQGQMMECEEMPGQIRLFNADGGDQGVSVILAARLGPTLPQQVLGCFVRPSAYGTLLCDDADPGMACAETTSTVPLSSCEVARNIYYTGDEFIAICGRMTDVDGIDDHIVIDVKYSSVLVTY